MRLSLLALFLLTACGAGEAVSLDVLHEATPTYAADIRPLYEKHCVACHDGNGVRAGGVELERYENAFSTRVKSACTSIEPDLVERYAEHLYPYAGGSPCGDWAVFSMPDGAKSRMTRAEQIILVRWVVTGGLR